MKVEVRQRLNELAESAESGYGKLVQKLLAIAFCESGADTVTDRCIQGIDLDVTIDGAKLALEVKTSESGMVRFVRKDFEGLAARVEAGATAYLAVLGPRLVDSWVFARFHAGELQPMQRYSITQLRPYRDGELEERVAMSFDDAVLRHASGAGDRGQRALEEVLSSHAAYRRA